MIGFLNGEVAQAKAKVRAFELPNQVKIHMSGSVHPFISCRNSKGQRFESVLLHNNHEESKT